MPVSVGSGGGGEGKGGGVSGGGLQACEKGVGKQKLKHRCTQVGRQCV